MGKDTKISFRLSEDLKAFLSEYAKSSELSLTDLCIWILESFKKGEDLTCGSENERIEGNRRVKTISADFESYKLKMTAGMDAVKKQNSEIIAKHNENVQSFKNILKNEVDKAYKKGFDKAKGK